MKYILSILTLLGVMGLSLLSEAYSYTPLLSHQYHTGYVPRNRVYSMNCEIFSTHVKAEIKYMNIKTVYEKSVILPQNLDSLIEWSRKGVLTTRMAPADIGVSIYHAYIIEPNDSITTVDLGSYIDSQFVTVNHAPEAATLKDLVDTLCSDYVPNFPDHR